MKSDCFGRSNSKARQNDFAIYVSEGQLFVSFRSIETHFDFV